MLERSCSISCNGLIASSLVLAYRLPTGTYCIILRFWSELAHLPGRFPPWPVAIFCFHGLTVTKFCEALLCLWYTRSYAKDGRASGNGFSHDHDLSRNGSLSGGTTDLAGHP